MMNSTVAYVENEQVILKLTHGTVKSGRVKSVDQFTEKQPKKDMKEKEGNALAISWKEYRKKTLREWVNIPVISNELMRNGNMEIPIGTICRITNKSGGFTLKTEPCPTCGVSIFITKVAPTKLSIVRNSCNKTNKKEV